MESVFLNSNHFGGWELGILSLKMWITEKYKQPWHDEWKLHLAAHLCTRSKHWDDIKEMYYAYYACHLFILGVY